jgi:hypothetical protein
LFIADKASNSGSHQGEKINFLSHDYRLLIHKTNTFIATVYADQQNFFSAQTKKWQKSKMGKAYRKWMTKWGIELSSDELLEAWQREAFELTASGMLQGLPNEPSM